MIKRATCIFINYPGYPASPNAFMPDNGLASLAGRLYDAGHKARILDYGTVGLMQRLVPNRIHQKLSNVLTEYENLARKKKEKGTLSYRDEAKSAWYFGQLTLLTHELERVRIRTEIEIAEEVICQIKKEENPFIGFKLWNGDGFTGSIRIAEKLREAYPQISIFAGGPQVKFFKDFIYRETRGFDALAVGDGESSIIPLAEAALGRINLSSVPNIYRLANGESAYTFTENIQRLDSLPFPLYDFETYPSMEGDQKIKIAVVEDRRGCDNLCYFCAHPVISGAVPRVKTAQRVVDEFAYIQNKYGISNFRLGGSSTPGKSLSAIADEIRQRELDIKFTAFVRAKDSDRANFPNIHEAGLYSLFLGIESGSQKVLDGMNKGVSIHKIREVIDQAKRAGIFVIGSIIYPAPFDTTETRRETVNFLTETRPDSVPLQFLGIYPGTEYASHPENHNLQLVYPSTIDNVLASLGLKANPKFNDAEILHYLIRYKLQLLFPPKYWEPLPWKVNGMGYKQFAAETQSLYDELQQKNILTMLTDEEALMAHLAGTPPRDFYDQTFSYLFTGDWVQMADLVSKINNGH